jgi:RNA polymerase sigma factor (TIGR02999 family)
MVRVLAYSTDCTRWIDVQRPHASGPSVIAISGVVSPRTPGESRETRAAFSRQRVGHASMQTAANDITGLLKRSEAGDGAAASALLQHIYADLRRIARARLRNEQSDTLGTTALVHEAWLSMAHDRRGCFDSRQHYFAYAAKAMRHVLVDRARRRAAGKRQPDVDGLLQWQAESLDLLAIDQALNRLFALSPRLGQVVELRLFAGLSAVDIAPLLDLTERTVQRDWLKARALLAQWLGAEP